MNFWRELFDPTEPETHGQRIQSLVFELVVVVRSQYDLWKWTEIIPNQPGIRKATGIARYVDMSFMLDEAMCKSTALLSGVFMVLGLTQRFRFGYLLALLCFHAQYVARFCLGKTQHSTNMMGFALLALAVAHLAYREPVLRRKAAHGLTVLLFSAGYSLAALAKLRSQGLGWADGHNLWMWIREKRVDSLAAAGKVRLGWLQRRIIEHVHLATFFLAGGLLAESSALFLWWRRTRRWILLALAGMHIGIAYVMNILFVPNVLILLALALPIAELVDWFDARKARPLRGGQVVDAI